MEPTSRAVPPSAPAPSSLPISAAILPTSPPSFLPTGTEHCTSHAGGTVPQCCSGFMWSSGNEEPNPFSPPRLLPSPPRMQVTCGSAVTVLLFQLRAATVHHNMSACHQFYTVNINYWLQLWETLLSLTLTPIYILLYLGFLIVNSISQKPLWSTITVAILTVENKQKKIWMELNEFSNPKLPSAISLCYDTEIKPHSWHTKELSTHALWACIQGLVVILRPLPMRNSIKLLEEENSHPGLPAVLILLCPNEHSQCPQKAAEKEKRECQLSGTQLWLSILCETTYSCTPWIEMGP